MDSINPWYQNLEKAPWTPPSWVFRPAWTILYIMITVSVWLIHHTPASTKQHLTAYMLFFAQLAINCLWSFLFFGYQQPGWALINLILLTLLIALTTRTFYRINKIAAYLLTPYFLWTLYALSLNNAIWWLN